jgi:hypothetical protein
MRRQIPPAGRTGALLIDLGWRRHSAGREDWTRRWLQSGAFTYGRQTGRVAITMTVNTSPEWGGMAASRAAFMGRGASRVRSCRLKATIARKKQD